MTFGTTKQSALPCVSCSIFRPISSTPLMLRLFATCSSTTSPAKGKRWEPEDVARRTPSDRHWTAQTSITSIDVAIEAGNCSRLFDFEELHGRPKRSAVGANWHSTLEAGAVRLRASSIVHRWCGQWGWNNAISRQWSRQTRRNARAAHCRSLVATRA